MSEIQNETKETGTVVLNAEPEVIATEKVIPSREDLKQKGWSAAEMDAAEKHGMVAKKEAKPDAKVEPKTEAIANTTEADKTKKVEAGAVERRLNGNLPDFVLTPEQEKVFLDSFGAGTQPRAMYFRMKNERQQRQSAEAERDRISLRMKELEDRIEASNSGKLRQEVDENGQVIDPEDKPMTVKEWKAYQAQQIEEERKQDEEARRRGGVAAEALGTQEEYAKSVFPDYDETVRLAIEIRNNPEILDTPWKRQQAELLWQKIHEAAAQADKFGIDDLNSAVLSYEMGKLHPNYGKPTNGPRAETHNDGKQDPKNANGSVTPEQMKRMAANTQRRVSSASIPGGGGSRTISVEDVTIKDLNQMTSAQRMAFKVKNPARYTELLRG